MATDEFGRQLVFPYFLQKNFPDFFARFLEIKQKHNYCIHRVQNTLIYVIFKFFYS